MSERNIPPGGNNLHSQFGSLNIEAQPFVPNARAAPFVPVASGGHPPPGYMYMQGKGHRLLCVPQGDRA